ncbi:MAG: HEAT repeat domain-containing protein [Blastocatellia bacterium]
MRERICNRRRRSWGRSIGTVLLFSGLLLGPPARAGKGAPADDPPVKELLSRLASGEEEQRLDAAARLANFFESVAGRPVDPDLVPGLSRSLQSDPSPVVRALAARALGISGDSRVISLLTAALAKEREIAVRKSVLYALARYPYNPGAPASISALPILPFLQDKKAEVRSSAAFALAEILDPAAAPHLLSFLQKRRKEEDAFGRQHAARAVGLLAHKEALDALVAALNKDKSHAVRREAAAAIGLLASENDAPSIEALRDSINSEDPYLSLAAEKALAQIRLRSRPSTG